MFHAASSFVGSPGRLRSFLVGQRLAVEFHVQQQKQQQQQRAFSSADESTPESEYARVAFDYLVQRPEIYLENDRILQAAGHNANKIRKMQKSWAMACGPISNTYPMSEFLECKSYLIALELLLLTTS